MLCLVGHSSGAGSGCSFPLRGGASVSPAKTPETNEEDVSDSHEGKPPPSLSRRPRSIHWWVPASRGKGGVSHSFSPVAWEGWVFVTYVLF